MKRLALFCDGTWNDMEGENLTNVALLSTAAKTEAGGVPQVSQYFPGVGVEKNRNTGGIWGEGLDEKIREAYAWLCQNYEVGDDVFIFGFSRGAYTARSLVGLMRTCGIVAVEHGDLSREAMRVYRKRSGTADDRAAADFRKAYACACVDPDLITLRRTDEEAEQRRMLRVRYLGVWDTVGALGVPERVPLSKHINKKYRFHDLDLSRHVEFARHALAIDETRRAFEPTPWTEASIQRINALHRAIRVEQDWFPGDHGSVGGGGTFRQLSDAALLWIAEGAETAGLELLRDEAGQLMRRRPDGSIGPAAPHVDPVHGPLKNSEKDNWIMKLRGLGPRAPGPAVPADVSHAALKRIRHAPDYVSGLDRDTGWRRKTLGAVLKVLRKF